MRRADLAAEWRPFAQRPDDEIVRSLARSVVGDAVVFEEHHRRLGLTFGYRWSSSEAHGFVRLATLVNDGDEAVEVEIVDGLLGVLPYGLAPTVYERLSNLSNAYKRSELVDPRLAVYSLEAPVSDSADPEEVLRATAVWSHGLDHAAGGAGPVGARGARRRRARARRRSSPGAPAHTSCAAPCAWRRARPCRGASSLTSRWTSST